jgi:hypothetical protein
MWTWTAEDYDVGENLIEVRIRDGKHAGAEGFDGKKVASFVIAEAEQTNPVEMIIGPEDASSSPSPELPSILSSLEGAGLTSIEDIEHSLLMRNIGMKPIR